MAHGLLATAPVNAGAPEHGLFSTQLGTTGPRVVFLHGLFGQGKNWNTIAKALSESARVMLVDLPNHGQSAWTDHFSYPEMAGRVAGLLKAQGEGERYAVVGHSMGGKVAMTLALHEPELVERLCVVDVSPVTTAEITDFDTFFHGMRAIDLETLTDRRDADSQLATYVRDPSIRGFLLQNLRRDNSASNGWRWQMNLAMLGDHLDEMSDWPDLEARPYEGPVLWLAGAESPYVQPEYAAAMRAHFPRVQLVTIKGAGHWVHSEQPQVFLAIMRRFLRL
ncbi:MAG TPA: alpha/beta fold hydrolase [Propionibacteriaceae bacterium]|nr:alpha/beta fold hydrolase [Propionibacteriaceae bacterium]